MAILFLSGCTEKKKVEPTADTEDFGKLPEAVQTFNNAFKTGDVETLGSMITENYVHTNGTSKSIGKSNWLGYLSQRSESIANGELEVLDYEMGDMEMVHHDGFAIVTGRVLTKNRVGQDTVEQQFRVTHLWVQENGQWKRAGFHDGKIQ
nr:nuclear transport factor 2 family protein [Allomuricauda sp.]